jgi:hypothetical protein
MNSINHHRRRRRNLEHDFEQRAHDTRSALRDVDHVGNECRLIERQSYMFFFLVFVFLSFER